MNKTLKQIIKSNFLNIIIGLFLVMGVLYGYFSVSMKDLEKKSVILQNGALKNTHTIFELRISVIQTQQFLSDVSATRAAPGYDDGFKKAEEWNKIFHDNLNQLKASIKDKKIIEQLDNLDKTYNSFYSKGVDMAKVYVKDGPEKGNLIMGSFDSIAEQMYSELQQVEKSISEPVFINFKDLYNSIVLINNIILYGFGSIFILFLIYCGFKLKQLLVHVNKIIDSLSKIVLELLGSSKQSEADNENVQKYTDLQMKSLDETTEATIEIDKMVESNKKSAFTLMEKANEVEKLSNEGLELLNNVYQGSIEQIDNSKKLKNELATNLKKFRVIVSTQVNGSIYLQVKNQFN